MAKTKQIFQANKELLKKYPFYQSFFMYNEEFRKSVVRTVYWYNQASKEKALGDTVYLNGIGFAKGKVAQILSNIARKMLYGQPLNKQDKADIRTYGIRYVKQYIDIVDHLDSDVLQYMFSFKREYNEYASSCRELLSHIEILIGDESTTETQKKALNHEWEKLQGISTLDVVSANITRIMANKCEQMEFDF